MNKFEQIKEYILNDKIIKKYGCFGKGFIIVLVKNKLYVNLNEKSRKNYFNRFIKRLKEKFDLIKAEYFSGTDIQDYIEIEFKEYEQQELYRVVEDLQGGEFGMERDFSIEQWRKQAIEWATMDDNDELIEQLEKLEESKVIDFISEIWQLRFEKITKENVKNDL